MEQQGFYKLDGEQLLFAPNFVTGPGVSLRAADRGQLSFPVAGWRWFDSQGEALGYFGVVIDESGNTSAAELNTYKIRELVKKYVLINSLTAEELQSVVGLYPEFIVGKAYAINEICSYAGVLYRVVQAHTSQGDWLPAAVPALYTPYTPPGQVAAWRQPTGAQDAYNIGDKVLFNGKVYESLINANVWSPTDYAAGWKAI